ncbi:RING finger protein 11-like [Varroa jacobsoni]|uniref:RING-type domain-containing protein n=1 Tax=Varroa destructor TaxID=109461 RepID=A0A7M7JXU7_VARDE|nr:RING finger protein 11-like [Varroa destructor]XP_022657600.1 RING finger protein 11-like [Varroa destructor]XP_022657601.1 RING finger protein 11-like [Varroa destructor]XP_022657602.1 RING finger protein 11-like [Varroa destructor]XP_022705396.1 RING finger protein 11-like [Varroa jacobsoni]XP_022705397.1 RING finger protein 11-like [Varroa jacobsoni]XP_022705398.1 RING finger protein 11-like [Varroa jacobsoni]XP_022705399.1 RING finger protein 11-like [Varroa jacobsoni]
MGNCLKGVGGDSLSLLREPRDSLSSPGDALGPPPPYQLTHESVHLPQFLSTPAPSHPAGAPVVSVGGIPRSTQELEEIKHAQRQGFIRHLPKGPFDGSGRQECPICMGELALGEPVRFLPCLHCYHVECIDDWLLRSLTCPSCLEPVDAALLSSYQAP